MTYLRSLFFNFLIVFFVDRMVPGIQILNFEQAPNIGADLLFSSIVGFFNASVFPFLVVLEINPTLKKIFWMTFVISFAAFGIIGIVPFGVQVVNLGGFFLGSFVVWIGAFFTNFLEMKSARGR